MVSVHLSSRALGDAYHLLVAYRTHQPARGARSGGILGTREQDFAANVVSRLGGARGADRCLRAQRYGALGGRQQARVAVMVGAWTGRHGGGEVLPAAQHASAAQGPARGHVEVEGREEQRRGCWRLRCRHGALGAVELSGLVR
jgi:hypothetical protein